MYDDKYEQVFGEPFETTWKEIQTKEFFKELGIDYVWNLIVLENFLRNGALKNVQRKRSAFASWKRGRMKQFFKDLNKAIDLIEKRYGRIDNGLIMFFLVCYFIIGYYCEEWMKMKNITRQMKDNQQLNQPILRKMQQIKEYIGVINDQEVIRFCITYTFRGLYEDILAQLPTFLENQKEKQTKENEDGRRKRKYN